MLLLGAAVPKMAKRGAKMHLLAATVPEMVKRGAVMLLLGVHCAGNSEKRCSNAPLGGATVPKMAGVMQI